MLWFEALLVRNSWCIWKAGYELLIQGPGEHQLVQKNGRATMSTGVREAAEDAERATNMEKGSYNEKNKENRRIGRDWRESESDCSLG